MDYLIPIISAAVGGITGSLSTLLIQHIQRKGKQRLSSIEIRLLIAAAENEGYLKIFSTDQTGKFVMVGPTAFNQGPVEKAGGLEALGKLIEKGYVRYEGGVLYALTESGFKMAKKLGGNIDFAKNEPRVNRK